ncbi:hypothetical protein VN1338_23370 [Helicobacter pylori]
MSTVTVIVPRTTRPIEWLKGDAREVGDRHDRRARADRHLGAEAAGHQARERCEQAEGHGGRSHPQAGVQRVEPQPVAGLLGGLQQLRRHEHVDEHREAHEDRDRVGRDDDRLRGGADVDERVGDAQLERDEEAEQQQAGGEAAERAHVEPPPVASRGDGEEQQHERQAQQDRAAHVEGARGPHARLRDRQQDERDHQQREDTGQPEHDVPVEGLGEVAAER